MQVALTALAAGCGISARHDRTRPQLKAVQQFPAKRLAVALAFWCHWRLFQSRFHRAAYKAPRQDFQPVALQAEEPSGQTSGRVRGVFGTLEARPVAHKMFQGH